MGGSRWGWVLQIKLRCHTNHRSLGHHHHRSPSLIREVPGERTRHHIPQVFSLWCPHVRRPKSGRHLGDLQDSCLARQNKSLTRHYERRDIVPRPTGIDSYSLAKLQFLRIHRPICVASRSFNTIQRSQSLLAAALFGGVAMSGAFWDAAHGPALLPMALPWSCSCHLIAMTLRLMGLP